MKTKGTPRRPKRRARMNNPSQGFTLVETAISLSLVGIGAAFVAAAFTFSLTAQQEARCESEAARVAGSIIEVFRTTSYDQLVFETNPTQDHLPNFKSEIFGGTSQELVLNRAENLLNSLGLRAYLSIRAWQATDQARTIEVTVVSEHLSPSVSLTDLNPGEILVRQATIITNGGLNPS